MGSILRARCNNCGYASESLYYGGGFRNFKTSCKYPVMNKVKEAVETANIIDKDAVLKQNPDLIFYDEESVSDKKTQNRDTFHRWGIYKVYYEGYLCPKCYRFSLCFENAGCWD